MDELEARTILGVGPHAGPRELRRAFRLRSKATHPDLSPNGSTEALEAVRTAHAVLAEKAAKIPAPWWLQDADAPQSRVAEEAPMRRRSHFDALFRDALRRERER
jgi:curved DNA-binding protein CbpA